MNREEWLEKNSIKQNEQHIITVLERYGFNLSEWTNCQIGINGYNNDYDIYLKWMNKSYRIEIDAKNMEFKLFGENKAHNRSRKNRHHLINSFNSIVEVLDFIKSGTIYKLVS